MSARLAPDLARAFADVLDYPRAPLGEAAWTCERLARRRSPAAAALLARFRVFAEERSLGELQEAYTAAFDLDTLSELEPTLYPYVGHHLFDESHKRSAFLVGLAERYRAHGFSAGTELPDHLVVLLRFVGVCEDRALVGELVRDAIAPAIARMTRDGNGSEGGANGRDSYRRALWALRLVLDEQQSGGEPGPSHRERRRVPC